MKEPLRLSPLGHTWLLDLDGTMVRHNGHLGGGDAFLDGALEFLRGIPDGDMVVFVTSREEEHRAATESFLTENCVRYDRIVCGAPHGERILVNDRKPSGLATAIAVNVERDGAVGIEFLIDEGL